MNFFIRSRSRPWYGKHFFQILAVCLVSASHWWFQSLIEPRSSADYLMFPFLIIFYCSFSISSILTCTSSTGRKRTLSHDASTTIAWFVGWYSFVWIYIYFSFCQMKTTLWWSKVSFWCQSHQTTEEEEENLLIVFLLLLLVPKTLSFNLTSLSSHALANTNYTLMCLGGHTVGESHVVASMEECPAEIHTKWNIVLKRFIALLSSLQLIIV